MQSKKRAALGRGLGALLPPRQSPPPIEPAASVVAPVADPASSGERVERVAISLIQPNPAQPRQYFDEAALSELAASIKEHGLIQPILVNRRGGDFMIVAGERRWRAAQLAGFAEVPVIALQLSEKEVLEFALVENLQRENLNSIEEARAYRALIDTFGLSQEEVADRVGRSRPAIANALRLLKLPPDVQVEIESGRISAGHARAILSLEKDADQRRLRDEILLKGLSVRQAEQRAAQISSPSRPARSQQKTPTPPDPNAKRLQEELIERFTCRVAVKTIDQNRGKIEIYYDSLDELERVLNALGVDM